MADLKARHNDYATFHEGYVRHYIALADTKAGLVFALAAGLLGFLINDATRQQILNDPSWSVDFVLVSLAIASLALSGFFSFSVIAPRLKATSPDGIVFFGSVSKKKNAREFVKSVENSDENDLAAAKLEHCYDVAKICSEKYEKLGRAIWAMPPALILTLMVILIC